MRLLPLINHQQRIKLKRALKEAIHDSIKNGKDEPSIVAQLTYRIPNYINQLKLVLGGVKLTVGGVFIHQTPKVTFNGIVTQRSIELGDLLVINTIINGKDIVRKAILYQAKMFDKLPVKPDNQNQHHLYQVWPDFEYISPKPLTGKKRKVLGPDLHSAAKYLLLRNSQHWPAKPSSNWLRQNIFNWIHLTAHPTLPLSNHECFLKETYHFVLGDAGKEFEMLNESDPDVGWNRVINDLLEETSKRITSYMMNASKGANAIRGCYLFGNQLSFLSNDTLSNINLELNDNELPPSDIPPKTESDNEDSGGISVIEFVLRMEKPQETRIL